MAKKRRQFVAEMVVSMWVEVPLSAGNLADALEEARGLRYVDAVTTAGDVIDAEDRLVAVRDTDIDLTIRP